MAQAPLDFNWPLNEEQRLVSRSEGTRGGICAEETGDRSWCQSVQCFKSK